ncbi:B-cell receptor CD22-like [Nothobranchius furzeri]|uniref:B-cell receptor CD22-like n=1 Tax=Nothobranchius furzeri TaxID=105023 RepID=A0A9D2YTW6_NOTFU|nr:B-cell receptor CD22-like [Nothobranchius furzeri]
MVNLMEYDGLCLFLLFVCCRHVCPVKVGAKGGFSHQSRMFVVIWVTLFTSVRANNADPAQPNGMRKHCQQDGYCVTLNDGVVTAEAGLCAVIPCSFKSAFTSSKIIWYKCEALKCEDSDGVFASKESEGRVSLLESAISKKNCSIRINNLIASDSGSYQLRVEGRGPGEKYTYTVAKTNLSLTGLKQKPTLVVPPLTEGQQTTLTCTAPGLCSGSPPNITWSWRRGGEEDFTITGNITGFHTENLTDFTQRHSSTLTFHPSAEHHGTNITCKISFTGDTTTEETLILNVTSIMKECGDHFGTIPWAVAAASLSVNVLCLVSMWLLWNKSKKVKPNQEDRTYMSLQKMDTSPEYDVIIQNKHGKVRTARTVGPRLSEQISLSIQ